MKLGRLRSILPDWRNVVAALASSVLLTLTFPDFEYWVLAWFALIPLLWAVEREKASMFRSFFLGWIFGTSFFFATCWWLTYAPITYAGFPAPLAYSLLFMVTASAGIFPAVFAAILAVLLKRFGTRAFLAAPFVWVFTEFLRYWVTGNNWNAIGYSQSFAPRMAQTASFGGVYLVGFLVSLGSSLVAARITVSQDTNLARTLSFLIAALALISAGMFLLTVDGTKEDRSVGSEVVAIQPNVPMSGLTLDKWENLSRRHVELAESALARLKEPGIDRPTTVIFPESPMNFAYEDDRSTQKFINEFARRNDVSVLFNSAEPDKTNGKYFNSAVMVAPEGREIAEYDKIYLLPFGEAVPVPLEGLLPGFVGNFSYGKEYDLLPIGDAKAGVMICFESHFGQLSRRYVHDGADVIIEMTNDGYLGRTPVLRQHLANAVFRAIETNRPVLRVTNVGITAFIDAKGEILDATESYQEDTRIWSVSKSDGSQTFYVKYGDWFAWVCAFVTIVLLVLSYLNRQKPTLMVIEA